VTKSGVLTSAAIAVLAASVALLMFSAALAQQGGIQPAPLVPRSQGPGAASVLEIPTTQQQPHEFRGVLQRMP
jgi:hypothetical protein